MTSIFSKLIIMLYGCADSAKQSIIACKMPLPLRDVMRLNKIMHVKHSELQRKALIILFCIYNYKQFYKEPNKPVHKLQVTSTLSNLI